MKCYTSSAFEETPTEPNNLGAKDNFSRRFKLMFDIYEKLDRLDNSDNAFGISPLAYVLFDCAR